MLPPLNLLGLVAVAAALQCAGANYPDTTTAQGFRLVVNLTNPAADFKPSLQGRYINSIHVGAGLALTGVGGPADNPRVFYQNGTADELRYGRATVLSDGGTPPAPYGLSLARDKAPSLASTVNFNVGPGTPGVALSRPPAHYVVLEPAQYAVCNQSLDYYQGRYFLILKQASVTFNGNGAAQRNIPANCVPVFLLPECATLNSLPPNSISSHQYAQQSQCYPNVAAIKWASFPPGPV